MTAIPSKPVLINTEVLVPPDPELINGAKTSYYGVVHTNTGLKASSTTGKLCFATRGFIFYPSNNVGSKVKMGWGSVATEDFHEASNSFVVEHAKGPSHRFRMKTFEDYQRMEQDYTLRLEQHYGQQEEEADEIISKHNQANNVMPDDSFHSQANDESANHIFRRQPSNTNHVRNRQRDLSPVRERKSKNNNNRQSMTIEQVFQKPVDKKTKKPNETITISRQHYEEIQQDVRTLSQAVRALEEKLAKCAIQE